MTLQLGRAFGTGIRSVFTRTGGILLAVFLALQFLLQGSLNTVVFEYFPTEPGGELEGIVGLTLPVSGRAASALLVTALLLNAVYFVVLSRALVRPADALSTFPSSLYTRRMGRATLSMIVAGALVAVAVTFGFLLLSVPGIFLSVCFLFVIFAVGAEDRGAIDALRRSWGLSGESAAAGGAREDRIGSQIDHESPG